VDYHTLSLRIDAALSEDEAASIPTLFEEQALSCSCKKEKTYSDLLLTLEEAPDGDFQQDVAARIAAHLNLPASSITNIKVERLEDRDWLAESYQALRPFTVGPFFIYGSHYEGPKPDGQVPLLIEAATAFGSGEHGTTASCLLAIHHLKETGFLPDRILDMGCGSGILAIAAKKLWPDVPVFAADNDPECIHVTERHMRENAAADIETFVSEGYAGESPVWKNAPYDFIIANILAAPLIEMAEEQAKALADNGRLILSGMLAEQAQKVLKAYQSHGLSLEKEFPGGEWMTLLLRKDQALR
jgi:ribosomal protein L11 methyltransferase